MSTSSTMVIGSFLEPFWVLVGESNMVGSLAFRHVANLAKQLWYGAPVEVVDTDEMEELREERERSEIIDSGLDREEVIDGASEEDRLMGKRSMVTRQKLLFCA